MPSSNRSRKSTKAASKAKPKPKGKGNVEAEEPSGPTIADGENSSFRFTMPMPTSRPPVTPPQQGTLPDVDTTPTRIRGGPSSQFPLNFGPDARDTDNDNDALQTSSNQPAHEDSIRARLKDISQRVDVAGNNFKDISASTPYDSRSAAPTAKGQPVRLEGLSLARSIGYAPTSDPGFIYNQNFAEGLDANDIKEWLGSKASDKVYGLNWKRKKTKNFRAKHRAGVWNLPEVAKEEKELYTPSLTILTAIVERFVKPMLGPGVERTVVDTHKTSLSHKETGTLTSPDFVVHATGPSFEVPPDGRKLGYTNIVAFLDAKLDGQMDLAANLKQASVYTRQIFAQQPNRIFVRCLFFSEKQAQLIQFDRAGAQYTPCIDINVQPQAFIRMVVGVCGGGSERQMGFDDSFHWEIVNGRKSEGYLKFGPPGKEKIFDLVDPHPLSHSFDIRGCATTVWDVKERGTGARFIVKDSWAPDGRTPEHKLLEIIQDVKGVGKMVDFQIRDMKASGFRCETTIGSFTDRQASRVITEPHGRGIKRFSDTLELLYAVYDILIAHFEVYGLNILHRNITDKTLFLGCEDAKVGLRGILTGFEEALNFDPTTGDNTIAKELRSGTRFFQSCVILSCLTELSVGEAPPHDHTDDLESIFNLMCLLFFERHPGGKERSKKDKARNVVRGWDSDTPEDALAFKSLLFNPAVGQKAAAIEIVTDSWGRACGALFEAFMEWVWSIQQQKGAILQEYRKEQWEIKKREEIKQKKEMEEKKRKKGPAAKKNVDLADDKETGEQGGVDGQVEELTKPMIAHVVADDDNPLVDEDGVEELLDILEPAPPAPKEKTVFKKGLFAPLMENGMVTNHYDTVINFFIMAITEIELCPDQNGPPPAAPNRPAKRKSEQDFNHEAHKRLKLHRNTKSATST